MSILRDLAVFLISALFTFSVFMAVTSYTLGEPLQKENLKEFIETGIAPEMLEQKCDDFCADFEEVQKQACIELCISEIGNKTSDTVSKAVDDVYDKEFYGISVEQMTYYLNQFILFFILSIASGALILFVSKEPLGHLGKNLITVSITLFITGFSPNLIMSFSNLPVEELLSSYLGQGLEQQKILAIIFIVAGIALVITNYIMKRRKKKKSKKK
jgi:hypothetical protein